MDPPEAFAGVEGQGAADAAYETTISMESSRLNGEDCTGGAVDIFKRFDQIVRPLVYKIVEEAGMPRKVRKAYESFQEELKVHSTFAGGVGRRMRGLPAYPKVTRCRR